MSRFVAAEHKPIAITVPRSGTVQDLKRRIEDKTGILSHEYRLEYHGKSLADGPLVRDVDETTTSSSSYAPSRKRNAARQKDRPVPIVADVSRGNLDDMGPANELRRLPKTRSVQERFSTFSSLFALTGQIVLVVDGLYSSV